MSIQFNSITQTSSDTSPAKKHWKFAGKKKQFFYYDKEKKEKIWTDKLNFIILCQTKYISGYNDTTKSGIWSNFVTSTTTQKLKVQYFNGIQIAHGLYQNIKDRVKVEGGRYTLGLYIYNLQDKEIQHLSISSSNLTQNQKVKMKNGCAYIATPNDQLFTKGGGTVEYYRFDLVPAERSVEEFEAALTAGKVVDKYIYDYLVSRADDIGIELPAELAAQPEPETSSTPGYLPPDESAYIEDIPDDEAFIYEGF